MFKIKNHILNSMLISIILGFSIFAIGKNFRLPISIPTSSLPIAEHTVVLDAGHGQPDRWCSK